MAGAVADASIACAKVTMRGEGEQRRESRWEVGLTRRADARRRERGREKRRLIECLVSVAWDERSSRRLASREQSESRGA